MNNKVRSYITFTRSERAGIVVLLGLILLLGGARLTMRYFVHPDYDSVSERRLQADWEQYKRENKTDRGSGDTSAASPDFWDDKSEYTLNRVNINTADSEMLENLRGIGPVAAGEIVKYRQQNGPFTSVAKILEAHRINYADFKLLEPHLCISDSL